MINKFQAVFCVRNHTRHSGLPQVVVYICVAIKFQQYSDLKQIIHHLSADISNAFADH